MTNIQILLLCAGQGSRFDPTGRTSKLLAPLPLGGVVMGAAIDSLSAFPEHPLLAVIESSQEQVKAYLSDREVAWVEAPDAQLGMGYSIAAGVRDSQEADGWLICLGDMPYIQSSTIAQILSVAKAHPESIIAPSCDGRRGHPVWIPGIFKQDLLGLKKDEGPRHLLDRGPLVLINTTDRGIYQDIDTPADLL